MDRGLNLFGAENPILDLTSRDYPEIVSHRDGPSESTV